MQACLNRLPPTAGQLVIEANLDTHIFESLRPCTFVQVVRQTLQKNHHSRADFLQELRQNMMYALSSARAEFPMNDTREDARTTDLAQERERGFSGEDTRKRLRSLETLLMSESGGGYQKKDAR